MSWPTHGCIAARISEDEEIDLAQEATLRTRTILAANPAAIVARLERFTIPPFLHNCMSDGARLGTNHPTRVSPENARFSEREHPVATPQKRGRPSVPCEDDAVDDCRQVRPVSVLQDVAHRHPGDSRLCLSG